MHARWVLTRHRPRKGGDHGTDLRCCHLRGHIGAKARDAVQKVIATRLCNLRRKFQRHEQLRRLARGELVRQTKGSRHDAGNEVRPVVEHDPSADHVWRRAESASPQRIADEHFVIRARHIVGTLKRSADDGRDAECRQGAVGQVPGGQTFGFAVVVRHCQRAASIHTERFEC